MTTGLQVAAKTDVGMRRTSNQDALAQVIADTPEAFRQRGHLLMVADGMGAHAAGELASKLAADGVPHLYHKYRELSPPDALLKSLRETNAEIHRRGTASADFHNMGTTASVLLLLAQGAVAAHVGDSRIYRLRGNTLSQLTFDHSLQWELQASGQLPEGTDVGAMVPKNVITRSLGPSMTVPIDLEGPHPIALGDVYLLCSDGLTGRVEDAELGAILGSLAPAEAVEALVDLANLRGGPDNVTAIVARIAGPDLVTGTVPVEALRSGATQQPTRVHPAVWFVAAACALVGVVLGVIGQWLAGGLALLGAAIAGGVGLMLRFGGMTGTELGPGRSLGRGPYVNVACAPSHELVQKLAATLEELREAAREGEWSIDWRPLDEFCRQASAADEGGDYAEAVRQYCRGISYVMKELRSQNGKRAGDSAISY